MKYPRRNDLILHAIPRSGALSAMATPFECLNEAQRSAHLADVAHGEEHGQGEAEGEREHRRTNDTCQPGITVPCYGMVIVAVRAVVRRCVRIRRVSVRAVRSLFTVRHVWIAGTEMCRRNQRQ